MINLNVFEGRLGAKPELKYSSGGNAYAKVGLAVNKSRKVEGEWKTETTWVDLVFFGNKAENVANVLNKGDLISVVSEYQKQKYQNDAGQNRYSHSFVVQNWSRLSSGSSSGSSDEGYEEEEDTNIPF